MRLLHDVRFSYIHLVAIIGLFIGCSTPVPADGPSYASVRERLADGPTRLLVTGEPHAGIVFATRRTRDGWSDSAHVIGTDRGELSASVDETAGSLMLSTLEVLLAPVDVPIEGFETTAQLTDLRLSLRAPMRGETSWNGADEVASRGTVLLNLDWAISIGGNKTPLGTQPLPPLRLDAAISGSGERVGASLRLTFDGELWNWADLLKLERLELAIAAASS